MKVSAWLLVFLGSLPIASADSWGEPASCEAVSDDGLYYVQLVPSEDEHDVAQFALVRRAQDRSPKPPQTGSVTRELGLPEIQYSPADGRMVLVKARLVPEEGDEVLAEGRCLVPMRVACLDRGAGFVLLDVHGGSLGRLPVLTRYDGEGKVVWAKKLSDLFSASQIAGFQRTSSNYWWRYSAWVTGEHVIAIYSGEHGRPELLRVNVDTGAVSEGAPQDMLSRLAPHSGLPEETDCAAWAALHHPCPEARDLARARWESRVPLVTHLRLGLLLTALGDPQAERQVRDLIERGLSPKRHDDPWGNEETKALCYVLRNLQYAFGSEALELLSRASRTDYWLPAFIGLADMGPPGVEAAVVEAVDRVAPDDPADALWAMRGEFTEHDPRLVQELTAVLPQLEFPRERVLAVRWLYELDEQGETLSALKAALEDPSREVRSAAVAAIVRLDASEARHHLVAVIEASESKEHRKVVEPALKKIGAALQAEGESSWWVLLLYWRTELLAGLGCALVWYALIAWGWPRAWRLGWRRVSVSTLVVALPPLLGTWLALVYVAEREWSYLFLPKPPAFSFLPVLDLVGVSFSALWVLLAVAVMAWSPAPVPGPLLPPNAGEARPGGSGVEREAAS